MQPLTASLGGNNANLQEAAKLNQFYDFVPGTTDYNRNTAVQSFLEDPTVDGNYNVGPISGLKWTLPGSIYKMLITKAPIDKVPSGQIAPLRISFFLDRDYLDTAYDNQYGKLFAKFRKPAPSNVVRYDICLVPDAQKVLIVKFVLDNNDGNYKAAKMDPMIDNNDVKNLLAALLTNGKLAQFPQVGAMPQFLQVLLSGINNCHTISQFEALIDKMVKTPGINQYIYASDLLQQPQITTTNQIQTTTVQTTTTEFPGSELPQITLVDDTFIGMPPVGAGAGGAGATTTTTTTTTTTATTGYGTATTTQSGGGISTAYAGAGAGAESDAGAGAGAGAGQAGAGSGIATTTTTTATTGDGAENYTVSEHIYEGAGAGAGAGAGGAGAGAGEGQAGEGGDNDHGYSSSSTNNQFPPMSSPFGIGMPPQPQPRLSNGAVNRYNTILTNLQNKLNDLKNKRLALQGKNLQMQLRLGQLAANTDIYSQRIIDLSKQKDLNLLHKIVTDNANNAALSERNKKAFIAQAMSQGSSPRAKLFALSEYGTAEQKQEANLLRAEYDKCIKNGATKAINLNMLGNLQNYIAKRFATVFADKIQEISNGNKSEMFNLPITRTAITDTRYEFS